MDTILVAVLVALGAGALGSFAGYFVRSIAARQARDLAMQAAEQQVRRADARSKEILLEAKEQALQVRSTAEANLREQRQVVERNEARLKLTEENLDKRSDDLQTQKTELKRLVDEVDKERGDLADMLGKETERLESLSGLSLSEAKELLLERADDEIQFELARRFQHAEAEAYEGADKRAREIISESIQRLAAEVVAESTVSTIPLPNDEMKGRLIGREGRNIRTLEALTGVDVIIDDTPEAVTVSCFDPVRREIARLALEKLVSDGRIQPARIEDMVNRAQEEIEQIIMKAGEQATFDAGVSGLDSELIHLLGRLKYRYSYGENVLKHSIEVSLLSGMLAAEAGANVQVAKMGGLLHDIGKAVTHEVSGPHAEIGAEIARKHGINHSSYRGILEHHSDDHETVESFLVATADAISASRPGARRESLELYVKRLKELEEVATSFTGVERVFAIQAGREVRVMVKPDDLDDVEAASLARNIAKKVEEELVFPGQIKVTVIRETRNVEYAK